MTAYKSNYSESLLINVSHLKLGQQQVLHPVRHLDVVQKPVKIWKMQSQQSQQPPQFNPASRSTPAVAFALALMLGPLLPPEKSFPITGM
jgi:hypothetical protein